MKMSEVMVVRLYLNEGESQLESLLKRLHDWEKVKGVSVFRGVAGFGDSGKIHTTRLIDLSLELPLVLEFFDTPEKVAQILEHLQPIIKPGHMLSFSALINDE